MDKYFSSLNKFLTSKIGAFFIVLPFIKPAAELTGKFDTVFDVWKLVAAALIFLACVRSINKAKCIFFFISGLQMVFLIATLFQNGDLKAAIVQVVSVICICAYFDYFMRLDSRKAVETLLLPIVFMSLLTALSMFVFYPRGMYSVGEASDGYVEYQNYLWGFDNSSIFNFIPGMYLLGVYALIINTRKIYKVAFSVLCFISLAFLYVFSIAAFLGCFTILTAFVVYMIIKRKVKIFTTRNLVVLVIVIGLVLLIGKDKLSILMDFSKLTDKYYSIKARFVFWNLVVDYWKASPIIGYGIEDKLIIFNKLMIDHPHNYFMDVLYRGGILGVLFDGGIFYSIIKGKWKDSHLNGFSAVSLFVLLLIAQFDFYNDHYLFYPLIIVVVYLKDYIILRDGSNSAEGINRYGFKE